MCRFCTVGWNPLTLKTENIAVSFVPFQVYSKMVIRLLVACISIPFRHLDLIYDCLNSFSQSGSKVCAVGYDNHGKQVRLSPCKRFLASVHFLCIEKNVACELCKRRAMERWRTGSNAALSALYSNQQPRCRSFYDFDMACILTSIALRMGRRWKSFDVGLDRPQQSDENICINIHYFLTTASDSLHSKYQFPR